jgi:hypothetical protein
MAGSKRHLIADPLRLDAAEMRMLLADLDARLAARGAVAAVYVVGGAALALNGDRAQLTPDIDVVASETAIWEEAHAMAAEYGLPRSWINDRATPFVPPRPPEALVPPTKIGLTVHLAPPRHLLAMKIVALRAKDRPDIERLLVDLSMVHAPAEAFAELLLEVFCGEGRLEQALGASRIDPQAAWKEAMYLGEATVRLAHRLRPAARKGSGLSARRPPSPAPGSGSSPPAAPG